MPVWHAEEVIINEGQLCMDAQLSAFVHGRMYARPLLMITFEGSRRP